MEEAKLVAFLATNIGGMGTLAFVLLHLLRDALKAFREEIATERKNASEMLSAERAMRSTERSSDLSERGIHQAALLLRLEKIQIEVAEIKQMLMDSRREEEEEEEDDDRGNSSSRHQQQQQKK